MTQTELANPAISPAQGTKPQGNTLPRRTHAAMRRDMRARLMHATIETLVEDGYSGTSVQAICKRAGVSKGALFRHFPTRLDLMVATARNAYKSTIAEFRHDFGNITLGRDLSSTILIMMRRIYRRPLNIALGELHVASRSDTALGDALRPTFTVYTRGVHSLARAIFPSAAQSNPRFFTVVDTVRMALIGEHLLEPVNTRNAEEVEQRLNFLAEIVEREVLTYGDLEHP